MNEDKWLNKLKKFFKNKSILVLGLGIEGKSAINFLGRNYEDILYSKLFILDKIKTNEEVEKIVEDESNKKIEEINGKNIPSEFYDDILETEYNEEYNLNNYDIILKSPGIKLNELVSKKYKEKIYSQIEIFLKFFPGITIGITGTKGKSTTSSLIHFILKKCGYDSYLMGNIGNAVFYNLSKINKKSIAVIELSSFALENIVTPTNIAIITNIFIAHLDHHKDLDEYISSKIKIFKNIDNFQKEKNNHKVKYYKKYIIEKTENYIKSGYENNVICIKDIKVNIGKTNLLGEHNILNAKVAKKALLDLGENLKLEKLSEKNIDKAIEEFKGLKHRLELVYKDDNISYINDSIATVPESTINALKSVSDVETLILGGDDNMLPTEKVIKYINEISEDKKNTLKNLILLPDSGKRIEKEFSKKYNIFLVENVREAANLAKKIHKNGSVLLSPAARSYGYYKSFEDRGDQFKDEIKKMYNFKD